MKIRDLLYKYKIEENRLRKVAKDYYNEHYCGYMGEWFDGSEEEYNKLLQDISNYLEQEVEF